MESWEDDGGSIAAHAVEKFNFWASMLHSGRTVHSWANWQAEAAPELDTGATHSAWLHVWSEDDSHTRKFLVTWTEV